MASKLKKGGKFMNKNSKSRIKKKRRDKSQGPPSAAARKSKSSSGRNEAPKPFHPMPWSPSSQDQTASPGAGHAGGGSGSRAAGVDVGASSATAAGSICLPPPPPPPPPPSAAPQPGGEEPARVGKGFGKNGGWKLGAKHIKRALGEGRRGRSAVRAEQRHERLLRREKRREKRAKKEKLPLALEPVPRAPSSEDEEEEDREEAARMAAFKSVIVDGSAVVKAAAEPPPGARKKARRGLKKVGGDGRLRKRLADVEEDDPELEIYQIKAQDMLHKHLDRAFEVPLEGNRSEGESAPSGASRGTGTKGAAAVTDGALDTRDAGQDGAAPAGGVRLFSKAAAARKRAAPACR